MITTSYKHSISLFLFENTENLSIVLMWPWIWIFKDFVPRKIISCQVLIKVQWMLSVLFTNKLLSVDSPPLTPLQLNWGFWELFPSQYLWCHQVSTIININAFCVLYHFNSRKSDEVIFFWRQCCHVNLISYDNDPLLDWSQCYV